MAKSQSSSRSAAAGQKISKASNAIRRAISAKRSAVKVVSGSKQSHAAEE